MLYKKRKMHSSDKLFSTAPLVLANQCLNKYINEMGWEKPEDVIINIQDIYDSVIYPDYEFSLITNIDLGHYKNQKIWGKTIINEKIIMIDPVIALERKSSIYALTLGHEIGHALLHNEHDQILMSYNYDYENTIFSEPYLNEIHADFFAENLITPFKLVSYRYRKFFQINTIIDYEKPGFYQLPNGACFDVNSIFELYKKLAEPLTPYFSNISTEDLANSMQKMGLIYDKTMHKPLPIRTTTPLKEGSPLYKLNQEIQRQRFNNYKE